MANKGSQQYDSDIIAAMNEERPHSQYIKTILAKVGVIVLDTFSSEPKAVLLTGDPVGTNEDAIISLWSLTEDLYFKRMNKRHFESGTIIPYKANPAKEKEDRLEQSSDEELRELVNKPFLALLNAMNKTSSEALLFRLLRIAQEEEKSEKIVAAIKSRIGEIQSVYVQKSEDENE